MAWYRTSQTVVIKTYETVWLHNCVTTVVAPTFTVGGYTFRECACGYSYRDAEVRALGHSFVRISQSGNTATFRCTRCGYTYTSGSIPVPTDPKPPIVSFSLGEDTATTASTTGCGSERVLKSTVTEEHSYIYAGGRLLRETITTTAADGTVTTNVLDFAYDAQGTPYSLTCTNGTASPVTYYYITNLQGDVTYLINGSGTTVARYSYDPYGQIQLAFGSMAEVNPLRYRGYYYDSDTEFYYLQSRYYDPVIGRFISPDTTDVLTATPMGLTDKNLFAYCDNNPVMREDKGGQFWNIIVGAVIGGGLELAGQLLSGKSLSEVNWAKVGVSAISGGLTAAVGPVAGCLTSGATDVAMDALDGNINSVADAAKSFVWGTAKAAVSYGVGTVVGKATKSLTKVEKVGKIGDGGYPGVKYSYNKGQGRAVRSIELHPRHNGHGIHLQGNKWNPRTGTRSGVFFRRTIWR